MLDRPPSDPSQNQPALPGPGPEEQHPADQTLVESGPPDNPIRSALDTLRIWLVELGETVLPAIVIAVLINLFLAQATRVYGSSMEPNLHTDQRLVVEKVSYRLHGPRRGDVVVLRMPDHGPELLIKRIIGLPGETVEIRNGTVYINHQPLDEPYLVRRTGSTYGPTLVPEDHVFVINDNHRASNDSRVFGAIPLDRVVGRAWVSYWPLELLGIIK